MLRGLRALSSTRVSFTSTFSVTSRFYVTKYTKDHEWIEFHDENKATVGITDYAQQQLGPIVFLEVSDIGTELSANEACGEIESVKSSSELLSPVAGTIFEVNGAAVENPKIINSSPEVDGWLMKLEGVEDSSDLLDAASYRSFLSSL